MTVALLGGTEVKVAGRPLDPAVDARLQEARVDLHVRLPDRCSLRIADPDLELIDRAFELGAELEVAFTGPEGSRPVGVFSGLVASLEPEFDPGGAILVVRGYDRSHALNRTRRTDAYQEMSYSDIARRLAGAGGLSAGTIDSSGAPLPFVQQSNETDWEFLWRLADEIGFEVHVTGRQLHFRRAGAASGSPVRLAWGDDLLTFRPRATAVQQVEQVTVRGWDPATKQPIEATAKPSPTGASIGIERSQAVSALGGGTMTIADRPIRTGAEATAMAESVAGRLGETFVEAEGTAAGNPSLVAGTTIKVEGIGDRFAGTYSLSSVTHLLRTRAGYETRFAVSGRAARSMLELAGGRPEHSWRHGVVVGLVTNNQDPDGLGRVRVRYPVLGTEHEGWWARVTAPAAGARRGLLMTPQPGDEVLLAFEHDDEEHPYVVGSVWNGTAKPQELVHPDGSFALRSDKQVLVEAAEAMTLTGDREFTVSAAGDAKITTSERKGDGPPGNLTLDAKGAATVKSGTAAKVQAGSEAGLTAGTEIKIAAGTQLTIQGGGQVKIVGASVQIQGTGMVQISGAQVMLG
jgi:phage protein D